MSDFGEDSNFGGHKIFAAELNDRRSYNKDLYGFEIMKATSNIMYRGIWCVIGIIFILILIASVGYVSYNLNRVDAKLTQVSAECEELRGFIKLNKTQLK
jgi:hypothetical protein